MTEGELRFSIVIPCYNEASYIAKTLKSLNQQDFGGNFEIIVVDNNCTDNTAEIAREYGARVVYESNPGVCWARQKGTEAARGEIVISTDADTAFKPNWLSRIDNAFKKDSEAIAVTGPCRYVGGPLWGRLYPRLLFGIFVNGFYKLTGKIAYITATNIAFKKAYWKGYDTNLTQGGDELYLLRSLSKEGRVVFISGNYTLTSPRRLTRGLTYNFFITFLYYYVLAYNINKLFGRKVLGNAPAYRNDATTTPLSYMASAGFVAFLASSMMFTSPRHYVANKSHRVYTIIHETVARVI